MAADGVLGNPKATPVVTGFSRLSDRLARAIEVRHPGWGVVHAVPLTGGAVLTGVLTERLAGRGPLGQALGTALATWAVLGGARLALEGAELARHLDTGELDSARAALTRLEGRSVAGHDVCGLSRISIEALARAASDAVVAPSLWGALACAPGLFGARAVTVLRARTAHVAAEGQQSPAVASRLDDVVTLLPARPGPARVGVDRARRPGGRRIGQWRAACVACVAAGHLRPPGAQRRHGPGGVRGGLCTSASVGAPCTRTASSSGRWLAMAVTRTPGMSPEPLNCPEWSVG